MNQFLESLFRCSMERQKSYLGRDELRDYRAAAYEEERLKGQLERLLEDDLLKEFKLYIDNSEEAHWIDSISAFRRGLAIGLQLGAFSMSEY